MRDGRLAGSNEAGKQHGGRLLAKPRGAFLRRHRAGGGAQFAVRRFVPSGAGGAHRRQRHARAHRAVVGAVDENEAAEGAVHRVGVEHDGFGERKLHPRHFVQPQGVGGLVRQGVHVHAVADGGDVPHHLPRALLQQIAAAGGKGVFAHPNQHGVQAVGDVRRRARRGQHVAAAHVQRVRQRERHRLRRGGFVQVAVGGDNALHGGGLAGRQRAHFVAGAHHAADHGAAVAAEARVRPVHMLHRQAEVLHVPVRVHRDVLQQVQQRRALVPRHVGGLRHHVVALEGGDRYEVQVLRGEARGEGVVVRADGVERGFGELHRVHLVHRHHQMANAEQMGDERVPAGLGNHSLAGVDEDHGQVAVGGAGGHVARVLFVPRRVGDDEFALAGGKVAVRHVNGDALLALGLQAVHQQRQIDAVALRAGGFAVAAQGGELILVDHLRVVQQAADQGALAVVHAAAGEELQNLLALVPRQVGVDVRLFRCRRRRGHQK